VSAAVPACVDAEIGGQVKDVGVLGRIYRHEEQGTFRRRQSVTSNSHPVPAGRVKPQQPILVARDRPPAAQERELENRPSRYGNSRTKRHASDRAGFHVQREYLSDLGARQHGEPIVGGGGRYRVSGNKVSGRQKIPHRVAAVVIRKEPPQILKWAA